VKTCSSGIRPLPPHLRTGACTGLIKTSLYLSKIVCMEVQGSKLFVEYANHMEAPCPMI
jgi:hypothetical protein